MPKHYIGKTGKAREVALEEHKASGFKMKGSPHKMGTIEGTSAYKKLKEKENPFDLGETYKESKVSSEVITDEFGNPTIDEIVVGEDEVFYDEDEAVSKLAKGTRKKISKIKG